MNLSKAIENLKLAGRPVFPSKPYDPRLRIALLRIPKTAGLSLRLGLLEALAPRNPIFDCHDRAIFGQFEDFETLEPGIRGTICLNGDVLPADADFVTGHISFSTLYASYPRANLLTLLREPVSRTLSHWLYWRSYSEEQMAPWGGYAAYMRRGRDALIQFLSAREIACQMDNLSVRLLLWPHSMIPQNDFIEHRYDDLLVREAVARLRQFSFVDIVENPELEANLETWLGRGFSFKTVNETSRTPEAFRTSLDREFSAEVFDLLEARNRLDLRLWLALARERLTGTDPNAFRLRILMRNVARHTLLAAATPV
jgi:hypothetical protein